MGTAKAVGGEGLRVVERKDWAASWRGIRFVDEEGEVLVRGLGRIGS